MLNIDFGLFHSATHSRLSRSNISPSGHSKQEDWYAQYPFQDPCQVLHNNVFESKYSPFAQKSHKLEVWFRNIKSSQVSHESELDQVLHEGSHWFHV